MAAVPIIESAKNPESEPIIAMEIKHAQYLKPWLSSVPSYPMKGVIIKTIPMRPKAICILHL